MCLPDILITDQAGRWDERVRTLRVRRVGEGARTAVRASVQACWVKSADDVGDPDLVDTSHSQAWADSSSRKADAH